MNYSLILVVLIVPIFVRKSLNWLLNTKRLTTYSDKEITAIRNAQYPSWYRGLFLISVLEGGVPILVAVLFAVKAFNTDLLSKHMWSLFAQDAIFFNPAPGVFILAMALFFMIFYGGLVASSSLHLLLPARVQAYMATQGKGSLAIKPRSEAKLIRKGVDVIYIIAIIIALVAIPLFSSVSETNINHVSAYPRHENLPLSQVQSVDVECRVSTDTRLQFVNVGIVASSNGKKITILSVSDGQLPIPFTTTNDIAAMYKAFDKNNITVNKNADPACAEAAAAWWKPEAKTQYDAFFSM